MPQDGASSHACRGPYPEGAGTSTGDSCSWPASTATAWLRWRTGSWRATARSRDLTLILGTTSISIPVRPLTMAGIEEELGVRSSGYFRWRTAHPVVVAAVKDRGFDVGLH